jgi:methyl-accepting chemotaxis protein
VIRVVRTSTTEMDRRQARRYPIDMPCRLSTAGRSSVEYVADLSERGAYVCDAPPLAVGTRGDLSIDGVDFALPFSVRCVEDGGLHLAFELDETTAKRFQPLPEQLSMRRAA